MWIKILGFIEKEALGLSLKTWLYIFLGIAVLYGEHKIYDWGYNNAIATVQKDTAKAQAAENKKEQEQNKQAIANASKASDTIAAQQKTNEDNKDKADELSKDSNCPKSDAERKFLLDRINEANRNK